MKIVQKSKTSAYHHCNCGIQYASQNLKNSNKCTKQHASQRLTMCFVFGLGFASIYTWELRFSAFQGSRAVEYQRATPWIFLHQTRILKSTNQFCLALNSCIGNLTHFLAVKAIPLAIIEHPVKLGNILCANKVYKGISNVASILKVNREVEEIILLAKLLIDLFQHHVLIVFVWNVPYHKRSSFVCSRQYGLNVNYKIC